METLALTPLILLAAVVGSGVAVFVWVFRDTPGAKPLAMFMAAASVLALAQGLALATPTLAGKTVWSSVAATASPALPVAWLATVLVYADSDARLHAGLFAALLVEPLVFVALVWTNAEHALVWVDRRVETAAGVDYLAHEYGLGMWAHVSYSYLLILAGGFELVRTNFRTNDFFRSQGTALLGAVFVPVSVGALSMYGVVPEQYALSGLAYVFAGVVITATLFRGRLLSVTPATRQLGREAVVDEMDDRIVTLDDDDRIVDVNPAAARLLNVGPEAAAGAPLDSVAPELTAAVDDVGSGQTELELDGADGRSYYDVRVSSLYRSYGGVAGRVVSLRDVTDRRQREQRLDVLNRVLRHNLRNELNVVRGNAELLRRDLDDSGERTRTRLDRIEDTIDALTARSEKIGRASRDIEQKCEGEFDAATRLDGLAESVESTYAEVSVSVCVPADLTVDGGPALEHAFEELLENAAEHAGEAPAIRVTARRRDGPFVDIRVADDGSGIERHERVVIEEGRETALEHGSGVGLWLVNWVVRECGGSVEFAGDDNGTTVVVTLRDVDADRDGQPDTHTPPGSDRDRPRGADPQDGPEADD